MTSSTRLTFKPDYSKKLNKGYARRTVTVDGKTFTLIASHQDWPKRWREYRLEGPDVALHSEKGRSWRAGSFSLDRGLDITTACADANLIRDEVRLGRGMAIHTAEAKAKKIIRKALAN
jgi:hypothetical protein